jgi:acetolactate synthase-1/2/3 large subunit
MNGGDRIAEVLKAQGIEILFTLCGGHISPILSGAKQRGIRVVDVRDEATAVFAADAVARLTGRTGVAAVTAGPGVTNTVTAVKNAQLAQSPVVILGGAAPTVLKGRGALQDIDQMALFKPHVKLALAARRVRDLVPVMQKALQSAAEGVPGPVFVECPIDLLYGEDLIRGWYGASSKGKSISAKMLNLYLRMHLKRMFASSGEISVSEVEWPTFPAVAPSTINKAAKTLRAAKNPLLVIGSQALLLADRVVEIAAAVDQLGIPVYLSGMARGLLGKNHPLHLRHNRRKALKQADCVVLAGVPCDFRLDYGRHIRRSSTLISVNRSAKDLRMNRRPDIAVSGDAGAFLIALSDLGMDLEQSGNWLGELRLRDDTREQEIDRQAAASTQYINPLQLFRNLNRVMDEDSLLVADGGDFVATASYTLRPRSPLSWLDPGVFGTLGVGAGFALGAKLARPGSEVWAIYGDGALGFSLIEFDTFVRHGIPIIAIVGNDAGWTQIAREQVKILKDDVGTVLARSDYHRAAEGLGAAGLLLDSEDKIVEVLQEAKEIAAGGKPVLVNALIGGTDFRDGSISM